MVAGEHDADETQIGFEVLNSLESAYRSFDVRP